MAKDPEIDSQTHRKLGVDLFNYVWTLLDKDERTIEEDDEMVHAAHASRYHWGHVGKPENFARGEWQVSRVYSVLGRAQPALYHAQRCLDICEENGIGDWDLAFAYEALARANMVGGDRAGTEDSLNHAREAASAVKEKEDRELVLKNLESIRLPS